METKNYTCIVCPEGCSISFENLSGEIKISGNRCRRGEEYVRREAVAPERNISSTVKVTGGSRTLAPVKTAKPIPRDMIFAVMEEIKKALVPVPVYPGQVLIPNVCGTGCDIVATGKVE